MYPLLLLSGLIRRRKLRSTVFTGLEIGNWELLLQRLRKKLFPLPITKNDVV